MINPNPVILPPEWWKIDFQSVHARMCHAYLLSIADRNGVCLLDSEMLAQHCECQPKQVVEIIMHMMTRGYVGAWEYGGRWFAWVPHVADFMPVRGRLAREANPMLPSPPKDLVIEILQILWQRNVTISEARSACPSAWGASRLPKSSTPPLIDDVSLVWECWRKYQKRPDACRLSPNAKSQIRSALKEASAKHINTLLVYAFTADEPGPRYWRGQNDLRRTYLGLDNLLRASKLAGRIQCALEWSENQTAEVAEGDGTTLGPMAAYRSRGRPAPQGTTTRAPTTDQPRLSAQCARMLELFIERGSEGVRTGELAEIARNYTGRISEIRGVGAEIKCVERKADGNNLYVLSAKESL